jgi:N-acetylneuraminate synthase
MFKKPFLIAEIGCNHKGEMSIAKDMIGVAKEFCKVSVVKFQKRDPKSLLSKKEFNAKHPNPYNSYGSTYGKHREKLEFKIKDHKILKKFCEKKKIIYSTSVWDFKSTKEVVKLNPDFIKVGSATNLRFDILNYLCEKFKGKIHLSLGMTSKKEEEKIINFFLKKKRSKSLILYACTSAYPVPIEDTCLLEIERLKNNYKNEIHDIGFSGHHHGIAIDIAAYTLGANYIERHFTLDRTWKGTDHAASLEPDGLRKLKRNLDETYKALKYKNKSILDIEKSSRKKLKSSFSGS